MKKIKGYLVWSICFCLHSIITTNVNAQISILPSYQGSHVPASSNVTLTTNTITNIAGTVATSGGTFVSTGTAAITAKGIVWSSTETSPTLANSPLTYYSNGSGTSNFTSYLSGLSPLTTYYVRAYATSGGNTYYGQVITFITSNATEVYLYYSANMINWTVPAGVTKATIRAAGASGGWAINHSNGAYVMGGSGADIMATVDLIPGEVLQIIVGGYGTNTGTWNSNINLGHGGGGTFVVANRSSVLTPLVIAGGGGGATAIRGGFYSNVPSQYTRAGVNGSMYEAPNPPTNNIPSGVYNPYYITATPTNGYCVTGSNVGCTGGGFYGTNNNPSVFPLLSNGTSYPFYQNSWPSGTKGGGAAAAIVDGPVVASGAGGGYTGGTGSTFNSDTYGFGFQAAVGGGGGGSYVINTATVIWRNIYSAGITDGFVYIRY